MSKVAVTDLACVIVTVHGPVPLHAPPQPVKVESSSGDAVRVTVDPETNPCTQSTPQSMPGGSEVTVPEPVPESVTERLKLAGGRVSNSAVTDLAWLIVTVHGPVPLHAPPQPAKVDPSPGAAVRVTRLGAAKPCEQSPGQSMPAGVLVTFPSPSPVFSTESVKLEGGSVSNPAVTDLAWSIVTVHGPVPLHAPLQPVNREPSAGVGVSVTAVPAVNPWTQSDGQLIPAGSEVTVPVPDPEIPAVSW